MPRPALGSATGTSLTVPVSTPPGSPLARVLVVGAAASAVFSSAADAEGAASARATIAAPAIRNIASGASPGCKSGNSHRFSSMIGLIIECVDRVLRKLGKSDQAFQIAFLFTAGTSTKKIPAMEMANPTIEVVIRAPTLAVMCNPRSTNSQPPSTTATPISFMTAGCAPPPVLPSRGLILKNPQRAIR